MSINPNLIQKMLEADQQSTQALQMLLIQERDLLTQREQEALPALIETKNQHLDNLNTHAKERSAILTSLGFSPDANGWHKLLVSDTKLAVLEPSWQKLQDSIQECKRLNEINGKLMGRSQQTIKHLLSLIRGQTTAPELYNASGSTSSAAFSNTMAKA